MTQLNHNKISFVPLITVATNSVGRDFVCGDIHGCYTLICKFLEFVSFDFTKDRLFCVGDLVDKGAENMEVLELLDQPWFFSVRGNHDHMMLEALRYGGDKGDWNWNGGYWCKEQHRDDPRMPVFLEHLDGLPLVITVPMVNGKKFHVIHAELNDDRGSGIPITDRTMAELNIHGEAIGEERDYDDVMWSRHIFSRIRGGVLLHPDNARKFMVDYHLRKRHLSYNPEKLSMIYSGHTIVDVAVKLPCQTNLDTGAFDYMVDSRAGLTFTEPLTDKFYFANIDGVKNVSPINIMEKAISEGFDCEKYAVAK